MSFITHHGIRTSSSTVHLYSVLRFAGAIAASSPGGLVAASAPASYVATTDDGVWAIVRRGVTNFLSGIAGSGMGPEHVFLIRCGLDLSRCSRIVTYICGRG